jgi:hypothetical protein
MSDEGAARRERGRAAMVLGALWVAGVFATYLRFNDYPLWRLDVAAGMALLAVGPVALGWLYGRVGRPARAGMLALFALLMAEFTGVGGTMALAIGAAAGLAGWILERAVVRFGTVIGAVVLLSAMLGLSAHRPFLRTEGTAAAAATASASAPPRLVHLILDAHGGKPAFDLVDSAAPGTWAAIEGSYVRGGFSVWRGAYSRHYFTVRAVPEILGLGQFNARLEADGGTAGRLRLFDRMRGAGYRVHVIQNEYEELCADNSVASCTTYDHGSLAQVTRLGFRDRIALLLGSFAALSPTSTHLLKLRDGLSVRLMKMGLPVSPWLLDWGAKPTPLTAMAASDALVARVAAMRPGEAVVAHLLLPHYPYGLDAECGVRPYGTWQLRRSYEPLAERRAAYAAQALCSAKMVERVAAAAGPQAIIVVHGDHGSRIVMNDPPTDPAKVTAEQFASGYSTLFAVRIPGQAPRVADGMAPVSRLLDQLSAARWRQAPADLEDAAPMVFLQPPYPNKPVPAPMPRWDSATAR